MDYQFWQNIDFKWNQLKQWCLQKVSGGVIPPSVKEGGIWYDDDTKQPKYYDGTKAKIFGVTVHNDLADKEGGDGVFFGHNSAIEQGYADNAGAANGYALLDASAVLPDATMSATLADNVASNTLPTAGSATTVKDLLQQVRDNHKSLFAKLTDGSVTKIGTATVGSTSKPVYINAGTPTAISATVGSATQPVYLNSGAVTAITGTIANSTTGNAATATKLATTRTISLIGDVTASVDFDGSSSVQLNAKVADDSHNHVIANVDGLQDVLDSKVGTNFSGFVGGFSYHNVYAITRTDFYRTVSGGYYYNVQMFEIVVSANASSTMMGTALVRISYVSEQGSQNVEVKILRADQSIADRIYYEIYDTGVGTSYKVYLGAYYGVGVSISTRLVTQTDSTITNSPVYYYTVPDPLTSNMIRIPNQRILMIGNGSTDQGMMGLTAENIANPWNHGIRLGYNAHDHLDLCEYHGKMRIVKHQNGTDLASMQVAAKENGSLQVCKAAHDYNATGESSAGISFEPNYYNDGRNFIGAWNTTGKRGSLTLEGTEVYLGCGAENISMDNSSTRVPTTAWVKEVCAPTVYAPTYDTSYTLPANAPIGKSVYVQTPAGVTATVNAPSGTEIVIPNYQYGQPSYQVTYSGYWFVKLDGTRWGRSS